MAGLFDFIPNMFGGGSSGPQSQGPNGFGDAGYMSPDQLQQLSLPTGGMTGNSLASAYGNIGQGATGGMGGGFGSGLGWNIGTGQLAMGGLAALGNLWSAYSANSLAKKQLDASTSFANSNLTNQIKSYNTTLADREAARGKTEGLTQDQINSYVAANRLSR